MARVIEDVPRVEKRTVCNGCGRTIAYVPNEVKRHEGTDYGGGPDGRKWIDCPACGDMITLERW